MAKQFCFLVKMMATLAKSAFIASTPVCGLIYDEKSYPLADSLKSASTGRPRERLEEEQKVLPRIVFR